MVSLAVRLPLFLLLLPLTRAAGPSAPLGYNEHIQPILAENCFSCHGPDSSSRKAKLRLDRAEFATAKREDHDPAILPGRPEESLLIERIVSKDPDEVMPPPESHKTLKPEEVALLRRWVAEGATYQEHWSFLAPQRPAVPTPPAAAGWARNPVDAFIAERLAAEGLRPGRTEDPARLLRRVAFDLTGLPPSPEDLAAFVRDPSPEAYDREVDRLLATPASAEHFARQWLDAVRYADTHGIHIDNYRSIWPYRDWVVAAFRRNQPFDQFTLEQMAGDLLPAPSYEQRVASGYNRCLSTTSEGGAIAAEYEAIYAKDRVETMSTVWLGLTTGCAACHDHKFDPVSTKDFYSLTAFFRNNTMPAMDGNRHDTPPTLFIPAEVDRPRWPELQAAIAALRSDLAAAGKGADADFEAWLAGQPAAAPAPRNRHVRLHVPATEANGPLVAHAGGRRADVSGTVAERGEGPFGPAPRIDGADLVVAGPVPFLRGGLETFSFYVKVEGAPKGTLLSSIGSGPGTAGWALYLEGGKIGLEISDPKGLVKVRTAGAGADVKPGAWHHVALCFDNVSIKSRTIEVFLDGKSVTNSGISAHLPVDIRPEAPLRLGSRQGSAGADDVLAGGAVWVQDLRRLAQSYAAPESKEMAEYLEIPAALALAAEKRSPAQRKALRQHFLAAIHPPSLDRLARLEPLLGEEDNVRARGALTLVMEEKAGSEPFAHVLTRGEYSQPGEKVGADTPAALPAFPAGVPRNRLGLAQWLMAPENPLTARVTVNRAWQHLFGTGLVESSGDFGITGSRPSHPQLLDWLAVQFRESGWDHRALVRLLVTSATYRQSAAASAALVERDPANRLLARGPRHRLDAEQLRDQALAASGLLVARLGGPPVRPYQPEGVWEAVAMKESTTRYYRQDEGENLYRRSLYTVWKRTAPHPAMDILNAPSREVSCVRRDRTNTPLQALVTLNDPLFVEASRQLAVQAVRSAPSFDGRLDAVSLRLLGRTLAAPERAVVRRAHDRARSLYDRDPASAGRLLSVGSSPADPALPVPELAAWTIVASQVMNLDESLTK